MAFDALRSADTPNTDHRSSGVKSERAFELTRAEGFLNGEDDIFDVLERQSKNEENDAALQSTMQATITLLKQAKRKIEQQSVRIRDLEDQNMNDELTGLMSRKAFILSLERELARIYRKPEQEGVFITIELENLGSIQTQHGTLAGRMALKLLAANITQEARTMDITGRVKDNEFSMMLMNTNRDEVLSRIQTLNFRLNKLSFIWKNKEIHLHVSLSIKGCGAQDSVASFFTLDDSDRTKEGTPQN